MSQDWTPDFGTISPSAPTWAAKRPVRIALLGDFSARAASGRLDTGAALAKRKAIPVEFDTLEDALARLDVKLQLPLGEQGSVEIAFGDLDAFHPDQLYRELELFSNLSSLRKQLNNTATFAKAAAQVQTWAGTGTKASRTSRRSKARGATPGIGGKLSDFARLTGLPSSEDRADSSIDAMLQGIVGPFIKPAPNPQKDALVASVDQALSDAMRAVLHHADFQTLESLWRGVDFLLRRLETGPSLQVHLIDISAEEFAADLSATSELGDTGLYQLLADKPSQEPNGGYTLVCGLYQFEATPPHTELLGRMAQIARHAGAPFVTGINIDGLSSRREPPHELIQQAFSELRNLPAGSHLCLMGPRFMLRHPFGKRTDPVSAFDFEEFSNEMGLRGMLWGHPALLAACAVAGNERQVVGDLPFYHFRDAEGDTIALPCTERLINVDAAGVLRNWGICTLMAHKGAPELRLPSLEAVSGQPLGKANVEGNRPRVSIDTKVTVGKGAPTVSATFKAPTPTANPTRSAAPSATADEAHEPAADAAMASAGDDDLDALLASLSDDAAPTSSGDEPEASASGDDDLDALLASLSAESEPAASADTSSADDDMDPELAALLKSLE
jgi:type VI secretion system protein ImpC